MKLKDTISITFSVKAVVVAIAGIAIFLGLQKLWTLILVVLSATVIAAFVESFAQPIYKKLKVPRSVAVAGVYFFLIAIFATFLYMTLPVFVTELAAISSFLPEAGPASLIIQAFSDFANARQVLGPGSGLSSIETAEQLRTLYSGVSTSIFQTLSSTLGGIVNIILVLVISFYLAMEHKGVDKFLRAVTPVANERYVISLWNRTERKIGLWIRGQLLSAAAVSILTYGGLFFLGIEYAFLLSLITLMLGLIPFGILVAFIPAVLVALGSGGMSLALAVTALFALLQILENYFLQPLIIKRVTGVPSLVILISLIAGSQVAGVWGLLLGLPFAIMVMEYINDIENDKNSRFTGIGK